MIDPEYMRSISSETTNLDACFQDRDKEFSHKLSLTQDQQGRFLYFINKIITSNGYGHDLLERATFTELFVMINSIINDKHSDRGSQYTSESFRETLKNMKIQQSLSGVAHCYDNARMESFFATLKKELLYRIPTHRMTMEEVKSAVFRYVFTYYNQVRVYTGNPNGWPPAVYRRLLEKQEI